MIKCGDGVEDADEFDCKVEDEDDMDALFACETRDADSGGDDDNDSHGDDNAYGGDGDDNDGDGDDNEDGL